MFPELITERLLLQRIEPEDQSFIFEGLSHPDVIRYYGISFQTLQEVETQLQWYRNMEITGTGLPWKIVNRQTGQKMGVLAVYFFRPEHQKAELGFWLLPKFWNRGYALEAVNEVVRYWQQKRQLHRLEAFVEVENTASANLLEKAGFHYEGTMRDCEIKNGRFISLKIYALHKTVTGSRPAHS
ncbi:MAG TPA: GNAT family N-acetyltransferase [Flavisolibacter sp.]|nr:GNAT family N-acetyltransferase [Flavisolibacter sp.]